MSSASWSLVLLRPHGSSTSTPSSRARSCASSPPVAQPSCSHSGPSHPPCRSPLD
jgi:hypothetical protein